MRKRVCRAGIDLHEMGLALFQELVPFRQTQTAGWNEELKHTLHKIMKPSLAILLFLRKGVRLFHGPSHPSNRLQVRLLPLGFRESVSFALHATWGVEAEACTTGHRNHTDPRAGGLGAPVSVC